MTADKVREIEKALYEAQLKVEEAGRALCNERGDTLGGKMWRKCNSLVEDIESMIHASYRLVGPQEPLEVVDDGDE